MRKSDVFVLGVIVGSVSALLLTKKTGVERRQDLAECQEKLGKKTNEIINNVKESDFYSNIVK